ncbi:MAG: hypothetical protein AAF682_12855 [Planctomycetota bacterium]
MQIARVLHVERSALNRFVNRRPGSAPARGRRSKVRLLERLEELLASAFAVRLLREPSETKDEGELQWFYWHAREVGDLYVQHPEYAFKMIPGYASQARSGPKEVRYAMSANTLLAILLKARDLAFGQVGAVDARVLRRMAGLTRGLEDAALEVCDETGYGTLEHRSIGYAGTAACWLGLALDDDEMIEGGIERAFRASRSRDSAGEAHWGNLLEVLSALQSRGGRNVGELMDRVGDAAAASPRAHLDRVRQDRRFVPMLRRWGVS